MLVYQLVYNASLAIIIIIDDNLSAFSTTRLNVYIDAAMIAANAGNVPITLLYTALVVRSSPLRPSPIYKRRCNNVTKITRILYCFFCKRFRFILGRPSRVSLIKTDEDGLVFGLKSEVDLSTQDDTQSSSDKNRS